MKKALLTLVVLGAVGGSGYAYYTYRKTGPTPTVTTARIVLGDIVDAVGATGTLQAVTTVQVGTQVSGTIQSLYADFNSLVTKGQVLARLDPSLFDTQIEQARANLIRAQADVERLKVTLEDTRTKLARAQGLSARQLIPQSELDTAQVNVRAAEAQVRSSEAQVTQAQASLNQNEVNLQHTIIEAPIDGLVISRNVDVGQTVAASMQAPTLFILAADLTKMQVVANLDESDVGRIRPGQHVKFRVDAYPADDFAGVVSQVRLEPKVQQNVVTYATVIDVPNNQLKLKPGMTANVNIEIARSSNVLRVPTAAIRFRPTNEIFAALGQTPDPSVRGGDFAGGRRGGGSADAGRASGPTAGRQTGSTAAGGQNGRQNGPPPNGPQNGPQNGSTGGDQSTLTARANRGGERSNTGGRGSGDGRGDRSRDGFNGGNWPSDSSAEGGRSRFEERMQNLSPEERGRLLQRMQERGQDPTAGKGRRSETPPARGQSSEQKAALQRRAGATTIDALFGPLPRVETTGRVWLYVDKQLKPVRVRLGISDGQATELIEGDLPSDAEVVTNVTTGAETRPPAGMGFPGGFPGGGFPGGGFPGGGFPGGGGRGGGGNRGGGR